MGGPQNCLCVAHRLPSLSQAHLQHKAGQIFLAACHRSLGPNGTILGWHCGRSQRDMSDAKVQRQTPKKHDGPRCALLDATGVGSADHQRTQPKTNPMASPVTLEDSHQSLGAATPFAWCPKPVKNCPSQGQPWAGCKKKAPFFLADARLSLL